MKAADELSAAFLQLFENPVGDGAVLFHDVCLVGNFCQRLVRIGIGVEIVAMGDAHLILQTDQQSMNLRITLKMAKSSSCRWRPRVRALISF